MADQNRIEFEGLFREYFAPLHNFALYHVKDSDDAKNIVHEVFLSVWNNFDRLDRSQNFRSYLFTGVRNRCLNLIRDRARMVPLSEVNEEIESPVSDTTIEANELKLEIEKGLSKLPDKCRQIFELSRIDGLKYAEIAEKMHISAKTVEAQMSKALRIMRDHLAPFLMVIFYFMIK